MESGFEEIKMKIGLYDGSFLTSVHDFETNNLIIKIEAWNGNIIQFTFFDILAFRQIGQNMLMNFGKNRKNHPFLLEILKRKYGQIPEAFKEQLFQFLDIDDEPYLEIVCSEFQYEISA